MRLRTLAGAYAGQIQTYSPVAGLGALRSGTAERVVEAPVSAPVLVEASGVATAPKKPRTKTR